MFDLTDEVRHRIHRRLNRKYKHRDRNRGKPWNRHPNWIKRHSEKDYTFNRRKSHTQTGFGVGYERNPDAEKY